MGRRGPRRTPKAVLEARGSRRARDRDEGINAPTGAPDCPAWVTGEAREEWERIVPLLLAEGLLARRDLAALAGYCTCFADYKQACLDLRKYGRTITDQYGVRTHPAWTNFIKTGQQLRLFLAEFGLSPATRGNVGGAAAPQESGLQLFARKRDGAPPRRGKKSRS